MKKQNQLYKRSYFCIYLLILQIGFCVIETKEGKQRYLGVFLTDDVRYMWRRIVNALSVSSNFYSEKPNQTKSINLKKAS